MTDRAILESIHGEAFRAFDRWCREHDPEASMDMAEQAAAYSEWASKNSIEKYLDAAQPVRDGEEAREKIK